MSVDEVDIEAKAYVRLMACEYGRSGYCNPTAPAAFHAKCAHHRGGAHEHGNESPIAYLTKPSRGVQVVLAEVWESCPRHEPARRHGHIWHCPCECHTPGHPLHPDTGQLDLLDLLDLLDRLDLAG